MSIDTWELDESAYKKGHHKISQAIAYAVEFSILSGSLPLPIVAHFQVPIHENTASLLFAVCPEQSLKPFLPLSPSGENPTRRGPE